MPTATVAKLGAPSALPLFLRPSSSICGIGCGGLGDKGGKCFCMVLLGCSRLATSDLRGVGGAFPCGISLQVLVLSAQLGNTLFFFSAPQYSGEGRLC